MTIDNLQLVTTFLMLYTNHILFENIVFIFSNTVSILNSDQTFSVFLLSLGDYNKKILASFILIVDYKNKSNELYNIINEKNCYMLYKSAIKSVLKICCMYTTLSYIAYLNNNTSFQVTVRCNKLL